MKYFTAFLLLVSLESTAMSDKEFNLNLSGTDFKISLPDDFSRDFPPPSVFSKEVNIYNQDLYEDNSRSAELLSKAYWDYKSGFIFKDTLGTLSLSLQLRATIKDSDDALSSENFKDTIDSDLRRYFDKEDLQSYGYSLPTGYQAYSSGSIDWLRYEYDANGKAVTVFATPISDSHYLHLTFTVIDQRPNTEAPWKSKVRQRMVNMVETVRLVKP